MYHVDQKQTEENLARSMIDQDKRVIFRRKNRLAKELERDQNELKEMINDKKNMEERLKLAQREKEVEDALERERLEAMRQSKLKQIARDHHEVRKLKSQLQELLTKKQQRIQMSQHSIEKELSLLEKEKLKHEIEHKVLAYEKELKREENMIREQQKCYRNSLDSQMSEIDERQEHLFQEFLKEKNLIDELLITIQNEDRLTFNQKQREKEQIRDYIREFLREREIYREKERRLEEEENEQIKSYQLAKDSKIAAESYKKSALDEIREKIYEQLSANIKARDKERLEQESLSFENAITQLDERDKAKIELEYQKRITNRIVLLDSYKQHLIQKTNSSNLERSQKLKERECMVEQLKEDKRNELLTIAAKKRKMAEYHSELSQLVAYKKNLDQEIKANESLLAEKIQNIEKEKQDILNVEKQSIIAEFSLRLKVPEMELLKLIEK
eukprot:NODE_691_length_5161_cov_0.244567.p2 type:complete len:445 gc:universal NODE_691_length_5161_cov_0.244567:4835-3501(-)